LSATKICFITYENALVLVLTMSKPLSGCTVLDWICFHCSYYSVCIIIITAEIWLFQFWWSTC